MTRARDLANVADDVSTGTVVTTASPSLGRRNLIINGAMQVDQRGQTFENADNDASGAFLADRFSFAFQDGSSSTRVDTTNTAVTDHPEGFRNASKVVCSTVDDESDDTSVYAHIYGRAVEKQNVAHLEWGTSDAKQVTMSFWVKSGVTGTYILTVRAHNGSNYVKYHKAYTINSVDTWEKKIITIDGAGTGLNLNTASDNTGAFAFQWWLACTDDRIDTTLDSWFEDTVSSQSARSATGQVNFFLTQDAEFLLTGVQLEVGSVATPFEHRSYGEELALCQRYYQAMLSYDRVYGFQYHDSFKGFVYQYFCPMRSTPSITRTDVGGNSTAGTITENSLFRYIASGTTAGTAYYFHSLTLDAEL
jgi:hypothetical protein